MGMGDWGLGIGDWGLGPIPNPQSPIPNPQLKLNIYNKSNLINKFLIIILNFEYLCIHTNINIYIIQIKINVK